MIHARVEVFLKPGILDVQGKAIETGLGALGFEGVGEVRVGRLLTIALSTNDPAIAEQDAKRMCERLLANAVIETYRVEIV